MSTLASSINTSACEIRGCLAPPSTDVTRLWLRTARRVAQHGPNWHPDTASRHSELRYELGPTSIGRWRLVRREGIAMVFPAIEQLQHLSGLETAALLLQYAASRKVELVLPDSGRDEAVWPAAR